jgi:hypothetical protein
MPLNFKHYNYTFNHQTGVFLAYEEKSPQYPTRIITADVVLCGFGLHYDDPDHHVFEVTASATWRANVNDNPRATYVLFDVLANLIDRDYRDHPFSGYIEVLLIAETEENPI